MIITAGKRSFQELNNEIRGMLLSEDMIRVEDVNGQRYIGAALDKGKTIEIHGTPGNDMGAYLNGGNIEVYGNGQEAVGYAMRDGDIFVEKRAGSRAGIHMKEFHELLPVVVIGGVAGAFLGEYMAGGILIVLGLDNSEKLPIVGPHCATGMHGGRIFIRGEVPQENISEHITAVKELDSRDTDELQRHVRAYCEKFGKSFDEIMSVPFTKLVPTTSRPYANLYTPN